MELFERSFVTRGSLSKSFSNSCSVVQLKVQGELDAIPRVDALEKARPFLVARMGLALSDHLSFQDIQCSSLSAANRSNGNIALS